MKRGIPELSRYQSATLAKNSWKKRGKKRQDMNVEARATAAAARAWFIRCAGTVCKSCYTRGTCGYLFRLHAPTHSLYTEYCIKKSRLIALCPTTVALYSCTRAAYNLEKYLWTFHDNARARVNRPSLLL